jgi:hypothetical protein
MANYNPGDPANTGDMDEMDFEPELDDDTTMDRGEKGGARDTGYTPTQSPDVDERDTTNMEDDVA